MTCRLHSGIADAAPFGCLWLVPSLAAIGLGTRDNGRALFFDPSDCGGRMTPWTRSSWGATPSAFLKHSGQDMLNLSLSAPDPSLP